MSIEDENADTQPPYGKWLSDSTNEYRSRGILHDHDKNLAVIAQPDIDKVNAIIQAISEDIRSGIISVSEEIKDEIIRRTTSISKGSVIENRVLLAHQTGVLKNPSPIHIKDICSAYGLTSMVIALLRDDINNTSADCLDYDQDERKYFEVFRQLLGRANNALKFVETDIEDADLQNDPEIPTYWFAIQPSNKVDHIIQRAIELDREDLPESIIILTAEWYNYSSGWNTFPFNKEDILKEKEWRLLSKIVDASTILIAPGTYLIASNGDPIPQEIQLLSQKAMQVIDCARAEHVNTSSDLLKAKVQLMPFPWTNGIIIEKK